MQVDEITYEMDDGSRARFTRDPEPGHSGCWSVVVMIGSDSRSWESSPRFRPSQSAARDFIRAAKKSLDIKRRTEQ